MPFEYLALPVPQKTQRKKGLKTPAERVAAAMSELINEKASEGWEYLRADTISMHDKPGRLKKTVETHETLLVFRRDAAYKAVEVTEKAEPSLKGKASKVEEENAPALGGASRE